MPWCYASAVSRRLVTDLAPCLVNQIQEALRHKHLNKVSAAALDNQEAFYVIYKPRIVLQLKEHGG